MEEVIKVTVSLSNVTLNATTDQEKPEGLYLAYNIIFSATAVVIMFSMGTSTTVSDIKVIVRRPVGPVIGLVCQCVLMPACCFGYAVILGLAPNIGLGMVVIGSCPGGSLSNILTFWTKADVSLR